MAGENIAAGIIGSGNEWHGRIMNNVGENGCKGDLLFYSGAWKRFLILPDGQFSVKGVVK